MFSNDPNRAVVRLIGFTARDIPDLDLPNDGSVFKTDIGPSAILLPATTSDALNVVADTHEVLVDVAKHATVLPVKVGTTVSKADLPGVCSKHGELFDRFAGMCEARIVVSYDEERLLKVFDKELNFDEGSDSDPVKIGERVAALVHAQRRADMDLMRPILAEMSEYLIDNDAKGEWEAGRFSVTIGLTEQDALEIKLQQIAQNQLPHVRFELSTPLPIYSFV